MSGIDGESFRRVDVDGVSAADRHTGIDPHPLLPRNAGRHRCCAGKWVLDTCLALRPLHLRWYSATREKDLGRRFHASSGWNSTCRPSCAACHNAMDPIGFGLENYDAPAHAEQGRQLRYRQLRPRCPTDARLREQRIEANPEAEPDSSRATFTEKLMTYALGRGLERSINCGG